MTDTDFLARICANPDDDAPRLIYADWLEEQGQGERAEFIRVQCILHRAPMLDHNRDMAYREWERLQARERQLLCSNFDRWHNLPPDPHGDVWDMQNFDDDDPEPEARFRALFRRGFVERIECPCAAWLTHGPAIIEAVPTVREVRLSDCQVRMLTINGSERFVWIYPRQPFNGQPSHIVRWFDDALNLYFNSREEAEGVMSRCCLDFARNERDRRRAAARRA